MKIFVATDLHGSAYWTAEILKKFRQSKADFILLLGDVYNHGPRNPFPQDYAPMRVAEMLNGVSNVLVSVKGNCDSEVDQMISDFAFLQDEVLPLGGRKVYFTHGHVFNKNNLPKLSQGDVMLYGHFHVCEITNVNGVTCVNVGSCALPKDGNNCYCIVDESGVTVFNVQDEVILQHRF
ncbi:MAG: phosphodiesterase [Candidatus Fimimonas sp.]